MNSCSMAMNEMNHCCQMMNILRGTMKDTPLVDDAGQSKFPPVLYATAK
jgi:hypothetical protein